MSDASAIAVPSPIAEPDRWTQRWAAVAGLSLFVVAVTPSHRSGVWRLAWDAATWHEAAEYAATVALLLACLSAAFVRGFPGWLFLLMAVVGVVFYETS